MKKVNKPAFLLRYLDVGFRVTIGGRTYMLRDNQLILIGEKFTGRQPIVAGTGEETYLGMDLPLSEFIKLAEKLTDDEITIMKANMALTEINRRKRA